VTLHSYRYAFGRNEPKTVGYPETVFAQEALGHNSKAGASRLRETGTDENSVTLEDYEQWAAAKVESAT
jgi:hypothetical protein